MTLSKTEILNLIYEYYGFKRKREFSDFLGITAATLTNWYNRNSFDYDVLINRCSDIDLNKLFRNEQVVPYGKSLQDERIISENQSLGELILLLKEKDRQLLEMSEKIGQLKAQVSQLKQQN